MSSKFALVLAFSVVGFPKAGGAVDRQIGVDPALSTGYSQLTGGPPAPWAPRARQSCRGLLAALIGRGSWRWIEQCRERRVSASRESSRSASARPRCSSAARDQPVLWRRARRVRGVCFSRRRQAGSCRCHLGSTRWRRLTANCTRQPGVHAGDRRVEPGAAVVRAVGSSLCGLQRAQDEPTAQDRATFSVQRRQADHRGGRPGRGSRSDSGEHWCNSGRAHAAGGAPAAGSQVDVNRVIGGLLGAAGTLMRGGGEKPARDQAGNEAAAILSNPPMTSTDAGAASSPIYFRHVTGRR